jgi:hypothetical protein
MLKGLLSVTIGHDIEPACEIEDADASSARNDHRTMSSYDWEEHFSCPDAPFMQSAPETSNCQEQRKLQV